MKDIQQNKKLLRDTLKRVRERLCKDPALPIKLRDNLLKSGLCSKGERVSAYWPIGNEIDVRPTLEALYEQGVACCLPVVIGPDMALRFRQWQPGLALKDGPYGVLQPDSEPPLMEPSVLLVPLLGFSKKGSRLGYGGGYYDRTLYAYRDQAKPVLAVGVAFDEQELDEIPHGRFDQKLDWIVTPTRILQC